MNIASLVLGIVGLVISLVPCIGMYGLALTIPAIVLGVIGKKNPKYQGLAIAGIVCGVIGTGIGGWQISNYLKAKKALEQADKELKDPNSKLNQDLKKLTQPAPAAK